MTLALDPAAVRAALARSPALELSERRGELVVVRKRTLPSHGFLRVAIPRVRAFVASRDGLVHVAVRPDPIAYLVCFLLAGGLMTELTLDRATHGVGYPPEFVFGSAIAYGAFLIVEAIRTRDAVWDALPPERGADRG